MGGRMEFLVSDLYDPSDAGGCVGYPPMGGGEYCVFGNAGVGYEPHPTVPLHHHPPSGPAHPPACMEQAWNACGYPGNHPPLKSELYGMDVPLGPYQSPEYYGGVKPDFAYVPWMQMPSKKGRESGRNAAGMWWE